MCRCPAAAAVLSAVALAISAAAQPAARLWVLQAPNRLVEVDVTTFATMRTVTVPDYVIRHPEFLRVSATGQALFQVARGLELADAPADRIWFWDGTRGREMRAANRDAFLSADGRSLVWFANTFDTQVDAGGVERSVRTSARAWRTDLDGGGDQTLVAMPPSPRCPCTTGACSESCPEWTMWARDGVVDASFVLTQYTPGQLQASYEQSVLYRRAGDSWRAARLAAPMQTLLTSDAAGDLLIERIGDSACCGWVNDSSDQAAAIGGGRRTVLYDEFARFGNSNYDVSFMSIAAAISPGRTLVAHTIGVAAPPDDIRVSADGTANASDLARIRAAIPDLPLTDVIELGAETRTIATIRHAAIVGWLSERELLVVENGLLAVYDTRGQKVKGTSVAAIVGGVFLR